MNNRDPFNLRAGRSPAFLLLKQTATRAAESASEYTRQAIETSQQALEVGLEAGKTGLEAGKQAVQDATTIAAEGMAFAIPRNVPAFDNSHRRFEDARWASATSPSSANGTPTVAEKLGGMLTGNTGLPMYKDKPYYAASTRKLPFFRRRRTLAVIFLIKCIFGLYWLGTYLGGSSDTTKLSGSGSAWNFFRKTDASIDWNSRRERVKDAFVVSWDAYEKYAWGYDEFHPDSKKGRQMVKNGMGWIIVDALDTMMIMNLTSQVKHARDWVSTTLSYEIDHDVNTFETTIRMLGGLLSAYWLTTTAPDMTPLTAEAGDDLYLDKAADLADRLIGAFESPSGIPYASVNLATRKGIPSHADGGASSTAEATSLQLEFKYLAYLLGEKGYWEGAEKIIKVVDDNGVEDGLVPIYIHPDTGHFSGKNIRFGSRGDSYYEYLIKQYYQTSKQEPVYREMWDQTLEGVKKHLITYSSPSNFTVLAERPEGLDGEIHPKMDHLVCFMPGTIALSATGGLPVSVASKKPSWGVKNEEDMELAKQLMKTCYGMYKVTKTGLAPEIAHFKLYEEPRMMKDGILKSPESFDPAEDAEWKEDYVIKPLDVHNLQRPETVESLFYMWRITGDETYRHWGWEMFESFINYTMLEEGKGFSSVGDVTKIPPPSRDNMESFWLAETLKYFYLLFGPNNILPLDKIVLNTEAHPFPVFDPSKKRLSTGWKRKPRDKQGKIIPSAEEVHEKHGDEAQKKLGDRRENVVETKTVVAHAQKTVTRA